MVKQEFNIHLIGAAQTAGCGRNGAQYGPKALREEGLIDRLKNLGVTIKDIGDGYNNESIPGDKKSRLKNIEQITEFSQRLSEVVYEGLESGKFPLVIGGDHSLGIGSVCGASKFFGADNLCVIWVDAHTDINTQDTSPTGNVHGMSLASLLGYGEEALANICGETPKIKPQNIIYIGSRDIDAGEKEIIEREGISVFSMKEIVTEGVDAVICRLQERLQTLSVSNIYLSIDIDVIDPKLAPGTGVPVPDGMTPKQLYKFIDIIAQTKKIKGAELVEVNPLIDSSDKKTTKLAIEIVENLMKGILKRK